MDGTLQQRVQADLDELNTLAREVLGETMIPPAGTWARCWDLRHEAPVGEWHLIDQTDGSWRVAYRCRQAGIVTVVTAIRARRRFAIQRSEVLPAGPGCSRCHRAG